MVIVFDPVKDRLNHAKHGISLSRAIDMEILAVIRDERFDYREVRYRAFGFIDETAHCLVFTVRDEEIRAISLRRAHSKEMCRYGL